MPRGVEFHHGSTRTSHRVLGENWRPEVGPVTGDFRDSAYPDPILSLLVHRLGRFRAIDLERGSLPNSAGHGDVAPGEFDDPMNGGQPESRPFPDFFGREERLEDSRLNRLVHATPRVADGKFNISAGNQVRHDMAGSWIQR